jgi:phenylacetic acid degradation protein paaN
MGHQLYERHRDTLDHALAAIRERGYWSPYPEHPKAYGEESASKGQEAFESYLGRRFPLEQPGVEGEVGGERSPYGLELGVTYPAAAPDAAISAALAALPAWRDAGPETRAGVCIEILSRLNERTPEIAHAVMHTSGQAYGMAFQAGGPHAQDRGLEAIAYAYAEMTLTPREAVWEKPIGKRGTLRMAKRYTAVPRGVALVIGCNTFPTWNSYPGLFASLVTGNPVIVKPHPRATLPLAITVAVARETLAGAGFSPDLVSLAAEAPGGTLAKTLATRPEVRIIDYTGSTAFGEWLEANARQAQVYAEKAGVNTVVIDSTDDYKGMLGNLAFSLSLYSGQMCTTPQNLLVPADGIVADGARIPVDQVARDLAGSIDRLLGEPNRAVALLGAVVNDGVRERIERASSGALGDVVLPSREVTHPDFPSALVRTPVMVRAAAADRDAYLSECFGPVSFLVTTDSTAASIDLLRASVREHGAITAAVYSTSDDILAAAEEAALDAGVGLSCNLTGGVYVNQSAAFSDFHATGANPAANAALTDAAFVAGRFRMIQSQRHLPDKEQPGSGR